MMMKVLANCRFVQTGFILLALNLQICHAPSAEPLTGDEKLFVAVKDNSDLDWDDAAGEITDPPSIGSVSRSASNGGGSGGYDTGQGLAAAVHYSSGRLPHIVSMSP